MSDVPEWLVITDEETFSDVVNEMKMDAAVNKTGGARYAKSKEEAEELCNNKEIEEICGSLTKKIILEGRPIVLVLTVEVNKDFTTENWHLSMSIPHNPPGRVPNEVANRIADKFFDKWEERPTQSIIFPNIRDFFSAK